MMDAILKYSNDIQGRDKLYRTVQYLSKLLGWSMIRYNTDPAALKTVQEVEKMMSTSRKLFRFGRCIHSVRSAQKSINRNNAILRFTLTTSHLNKAFYLLVDHYIWLGRAGLVSTDMKKWGTVSFRFWFASLVMDLAVDFYVLIVSLERTAQEKEFKGESNTASTLLKTLRREKNVTVDLIKNGCNIVIPMSNLGYLNVNNGVVGLCGVISSVLAGFQIAYPSLALKS